MALCRFPTTSNLHFGCSSLDRNPNFLPKHVSLLKKHALVSRRSCGLASQSHSVAISLPKASPSDDLKETSPYITEERDSLVTLGDSRSVEKNVYNEIATSEEQAEDGREQNLVDEYKFDAVDAYNIILYGAGAFVGLWFVSAIVGAIDSIPVFPKVLEVVGLGYTLWFTTRYLIFKESRDELLDKIEEVKKQVLGTSEE